MALALQEAGSRKEPTRLPPLSRASHGSLQARKVGRGEELGTLGLLTVCPRASQSWGHGRFHTQQRAGPSRVPQPFVKKFKILICPTNLYPERLCLRQEAGVGEEGLVDEKNKKDRRSYCPTPGGPRVGTPTPYVSRGSSPLSVMCRMPMACDFSEIRIVHSKNCP